MSDKCGNCKQYIFNCECDVLKKHAEDNPTSYHGFNKEGRKVQSEWKCTKHNLAFYERDEDEHRFCPECDRYLTDEDN